MPNIDTTIIIATDCQFHNFEPHSDVIADVANCGRQMPVRGANVDRCSALSNQLDCIADVMPGLSGQLGVDEMLIAQFL